MDVCQTPVIARARLLTMRHLREEMVYDVIVRHIVQEKATLPAQEISVDCTGSTSLIRPGIVAVMWDDGVCMVQVGDHDEPVGDEKPRNPVDLENDSAAPFIASCPDQ